MLVVFSRKLVMSCFPCLSRTTKSSTTRTPEIDDEFSGIQNLRRYTCKELQIACQNFSPENKVGEGGFGPVFKGKLKDGTPIAIKVLSPYLTQGVKEFLTELEVITTINHENLVKLYGCCVEGKHRLLVYGYLENNSLAQTFLWNCYISGHHSGIQFSWSIRRKICLGVTRGLAFLHEEMQPYIVHRDIKANNILLDKDLTPKISDFGLAKLFPTDLTHVSTCVAGTEGYLAPEYAIEGRLTRKADVYSFGILLLEIVSGRSNANMRLPLEEQYLVARVWKSHLNGELVNLVDASLTEDSDTNEACRFLRIGLPCTQEKPKLRPLMSTVLKMLTGDVDVNSSDITEPGLLSQLRRSKQGNDEKYGSTGSEDNVASVATMTFTSIEERSNH